MEFIWFSMYVLGKTMISTKEGWICFWLFFVALTSTSMFDATQLSIKWRTIMGILLKSQKVITDNNLKTIK